MPGKTSTSTYIHEHTYSGTHTKKCVPGVAVEDGDAGDGIDGPVHEGVDRLAVPGLLVDSGAIECFLVGRGDG